MMPGLTNSHPSIRYYDSDYPGVETSPIPENLDAKLAGQGLAHDIRRFKSIAEECAGEILELGCGTGRVLIPLARAAYSITGVDISRAMIDRLKLRLSEEDEDVRRRVDFIVEDARQLKLDKKFGLIIFPFNGLSCIPNFKDQIETISRAAQHLEYGGKLVVDLVNPLILPLKGDDAPKPFFTRKNPETGNLYTRFAAMGPINDDQTQELFGWYDEIDKEGIVKRTPYTMTWRPIFRYEIELMARAANLEIASIEGDHAGSAWAATSQKIFLIAEKQP